MGEIVNLRRAKKAKARAEKSAAAEANRTKHGVAKVVRKLAEARGDMEKRGLEAHRLEDNKK